MTETLRLVHDVLDRQITDVAGRKSGRVDGLVIHVKEGQQPRVDYIDVGTTVVARRISVRLAGWYELLRAKFIKNPAPPFQIPWRSVTKISRTGVETSIDSSQSDVFRLERWLRDHVIGPIPGSEHEHRK